jgi:hypothetical protein
MKKIASISLILFAAVSANAQQNFQSFPDREFNSDFLHITGFLVGLFLFTSFFLSIIRLFLESRMKNRMIDKGVSETVVEQFLQPTNRDSKSSAMKWFIVSACIGLGLAAINLSLPLGIHSVAIMAFSVALGFLGYYFYMKKSGK